MGTLAPTPPIQSAPSARWIWLIFFLVGATIYAATAHRGPQWQDSGWQQWRIASGTFEHPLGLALTHPLQWWLGRVALRCVPMIEPAFAITLISSIAGAIAIANLAATMLLAGGRVIAATICAAAMMLSHTFWSHATHTESYAIVLALLSAEWLCLANYCRKRDPRWLIAMALANGLGISNHMLAALSTPVLLVILASQWRSRALPFKGAAGCAVAWCIGAAPYAAIIAIEAARVGLPAAVSSALFGEYRSSVLHTGLSPRMLAFTAGFLVYNFPGLTLPLALHAMVGKTAAPALLWRAFWAWLLIYFAFAARYTVADQYTFLFPAYAALSVFAAIGLADLQSRGTTRGRFAIYAAAITAIWTPLVYQASCSFARSQRLLAGMVGNKPYRDGWSEFFLPWGLGKDAPMRLNHDAYALAGADGTILIYDSMVEHAMLYEQEIGRAPRSISLVRAWVPNVNHDDAPATIAEREFARNRPVVLVPVDRDNPPPLSDRAKWERRGDLYVLKEWN